jgi:hypothetical protein
LFDSERGEFFLFLVAQYLRLLILLFLLASSLNYQFESYNILRGAGIYMSTIYSDSNNLFALPFETSGDSRVREAARAHVG